MQSSRHIIYRQIAATVPLAALLASSALAGAPPASAAADYSAVVLATSPLAYWRLTEPPGSTTAADDTGHGYNGTYTACVHLGRKGPIRNDPDTAGFFGERPGCWMTSQPATSYAGAFSIEAWVRPHSASKYFQTFFDTRGPGGEYGFDIKLLGSTFPGGQQLYADVGDGREWLTIPGGVGAAPFAFTAGHWYYIAATVNPARHVVVLYANGRFLKSVALNYYGLPPLLFDPNHPMAIGGDPLLDLNPTNPNPENFDGTIGQVAVYERVLTPDDIADHYKAGHDADYMT